MPGGRNIGVLGLDDTMALGLAKHLLARYLNAGLAAARPAKGRRKGEAYYATDTNTLYAWSGTAWATVAAGSSGHDPVTLAAAVEAVFGLSAQVLDFDTTQANKVLAGPASGGDAKPAMRLLVAADIPGGTAGTAGPPGPPGLDGMAGEESFPIPGPPGAAGAVGPMGPPGVDGVESSDGLDGFPTPGPAGATGAGGATGATGADGRMGPPGMDGAEGFDSFVPGPSSPAGAAGAAGPQGIPGIGLDGQDGQDAFPISGLPGAAGAAGASVVGPMGMPGFDGADGQDGIPIPGPAGAAGGGGGTSIWDADLDTGVQVEEAADEDKIRFDTGGVQRGVLNVSGFDLETHVAIGTSGVLGVVQILHVAETIIDESLGTYYGQNVDVAYAGYAANLYGLLITARAQQTGGTLSILEGLNFIASHESSLATGQMYGVYGQLSSLAGGTGVISGGTCFFASGTFAGRSPATVYGLRVNANLAPASKNTTTAYGVRIEALAATTTNYGIDIAALAGAGTNIGIRNASNYVATPSAAQTLAAGTAILANAEVVQINMAGDVTSTAAPTIADGVDGQRLTIINTDSTDHYVLSDQGTLANSNLRLVTTTITLHPRDSIQLIYSATIGDWVQIAPFTDVI